jgi:hypothetical protein
LKTSRNLFKTLIFHSSINVFILEHLRLKERLDDAKTPILNSIDLPTGYHIPLKIFKGFKSRFLKYYDILKSYQGLDDTYAMADHIYRQFVHDIVYTIPNEHVHPDRGLEYELTLIKVSKGMLKYSFIKKKWSFKQLFSKFFPSKPIRAVGKGVSICTSIFTLLAL